MINIRPSICKFMSGRIHRVENISTLVLPSMKPEPNLGLFFYPVFSCRGDYTGELFLSILVLPFVDFEGGHFKGVPGASL